MTSAREIHQAAEALMQGKLVAFPTETVYGLGADALNVEAVRAIFRVKGRPETHPLIVHIGGMGELDRWAIDIPREALLLAERFWPGPLTLILGRAACVPVGVTGGQETVGVRVPSHPVALALLREFGGGIAAPSANRFGKVSPTTADHVRQDLGGDVDVILDGGPCQVGIESTIVRATGKDVAILRPGGLTREEIEKVVGHSVPILEAAKDRVSGQLESHYAPRAEVLAVDPADVERRVAELRAKGKRVAVLSAGDVRPEALYASLRRADEAGVEVIVAPMPGGKGLDLAVADRLKKAAGNRQTAD